MSQRVSISSMNWKGFTALCCFIWWGKINPHRADVPGQSLSGLPSTKCPLKSSRLEPLTVFTFSHQTYLQNMLVSIPSVFLDEKFSSPLKRTENPTDSLKGDLEILFLFSCQITCLSNCTTTYENSDISLGFDKHQVQGV